MIAESKNKSALIALVIGIGIVVLAVLGFRVINPNEYRPSGPEVSAMGGTWIADELEWTESNGFWRISTVFYAKRLSRGKFGYAELANSLCGSVLTTLPDKPNQSIQRSNIYRVTFNAVIKRKGETTWSRLFDARLPFPVYRGACQTVSNGGTTSFRLAGDMMNWDLTKYSLLENEEAEFEFRFLSLHESFEKAFEPSVFCQAVLSDPDVKFLDVEDGRVIVDAMARLKKIRIRLNKGFQSRILQFGTFEAWEFDVVNNACVNGNEIDA